MLGLKPLFFICCFRDEAIMHFNHIRPSLAMAVISGMLLVGCSPSPMPPPAVKAPVQTAPPGMEKAAVKPAVIAPQEHPVENGTGSSPGGDANHATTPGPAPLFKDWSNPKFVFVVTGQQMGYIEPCGCTGLENQKGGLARRFTFLRQLREEKKWPVVPLDVGSQIKRYGRQSEIKFQRTAEGLRAMGYSAVALGADDLKLTPGELIAGSADPDGKPSIFTSANVALVDRSFTPDAHILEVGGKKIGVTAVLSDDFEKKLQGDELIHGSALEGLQETVGKLKDAKCDLLVLLAHASLDDTTKLVQAFPEFDLVVTSGGVGEPALELEQIKQTKSLLAQVGTKGMYVGVIGFFDDAKTPWRYQRVPLDSSYADAPEMMKLLADYQKQLEQNGLQEIGATEQPHPSNRKFTGSEKCGECHSKAWEVWKATPHAHATDSLKKPPGRADIARHYDPECLSCHVTGWEPQKFYPFTSGYLSLTKTPHLQQNGCENCHGPGSAHVDAESSGSATAEDLAKFRDEMKLPLQGGVAEKKCMQCHDLDNSPDFHVKGAFEKYWKKVEHLGKD